MTGYIKLYRKFIKWEWYSDVNVSRLFLHLLFKANYEDKRWQGTEIKAGQLITSLDHLSKETGLSKQQVRTAIQKLKNTGEINTRATRQYSIITINNWYAYQDDNTRATHEQHTSNTRATLTKEIKKERNKENNICPFSYSKNFLEWFALYPRKESKKKAAEAYERALKDGVTDQQLLAGVKSYNEHISAANLERQYIKMPTTWLNQGCWEDDYKTKKTSILDGIIK